MTRIPVLLLVAFLAGCHRYWAAADDFRRQLRCGMNEEEIRKLARDLGATEVFGATTLSPDLPSHVVRQGSTRFDLWLSDSTGLTWFQQGRYYGVTGLRVSIRRNLCTGEQTGYPMFEFRAPAQLKGATIYLDGNRFGQLSTGEGSIASAGIGAPVLTFGVHEVRIEKPGYRPITRQITYSPKQFWPEIETVLVEITAVEVRTAG